MHIKFSQKQLVIIGGSVVLVVGILMLLFFNMRPTANTGPAIKMKIWGVEDAQTFGSFLKSYPYAKIAYTQVDPANYDSQLLSALAAGTGPDVFEILNRDVPKWKSVITPLPATYAKTFGPLQFQAAFPDVVAQDFVEGSTTYGLPLSIDTLAMFYNKDLFNSAGIALPPKTWGEFDTDVALLRAVSGQGQISQAAAAIGGTSESIPNAIDILSLLMLQNGTKMTSDNLSSAAFAAPGSPGIDAFKFYLQFANAASPYYTWNDGMGSAVDSFAAGKTAIIFGYHSDFAEIKAKAPFLDFGVAPMLQPDGATIVINYPKYYGFVAAKAGQTAVAWNFILYMATTPAIGKRYQSIMDAPPALRANIDAAKNSTDLSVFASQVLTARSWYEADSTKIDGILDTTIKKVLNGAEDSTKALLEAASAVTSLM